MRAVRRAVSKNKARYVDASLDVDLDLSYVLPGRVAAMGVPAVSWWHAAYRNPAEEVARLLSARHSGGSGQGGAPRIYDLCSEHWSSSAADNTDGAYAPPDLLSENQGGAVVRAPMDDHQAPPLQGVARVVADAAAWLARHQDNAVFVHCKAGKGRSGVVVCCLLLHLWMAAEEEAALRESRPRLRPFSSSSGVRGWWSEDSGDFEDAKTNKPPAAGEVEMGPVGAAAAGANRALAPPTEKNVDQPPPSSPPPGGEGYEHDDAAEAARLAAEQAMAFYAARRTRDGQGVTIPSQRRYVHYFARVLAWRWRRRQGRGAKDDGDDDNEQDNSDGWAPRVVCVTVSGIPGLGVGGDGGSTTTNNLALQLTFREAPRFLPAANNANDLEVKLYPPVAERTVIVPLNPTKDGAVVPAVVREGRRRGGAGLACLGSPAAMRRASASGAAAAPLARVVTDEEPAISVMLDANEKDDDGDATVVPAGGDVRFRVVAGGAQQPLLTAWLHPRLALGPPPPSATGSGPHPAGVVRLSGRAQLDKLPRRLAGGGGAGVDAGPSLEVAFEWVRRRRRGTLEAISVVDAAPDSRPLAGSTTMGGAIEMRRIGAGG